MSEQVETSVPPQHAETPVGNAAGFTKYLQQDLLSGFLVFLIALPLCLGIALASGYPAIAGVFTAIMGAILTTFISNSELTIKGPAAGLIVIAIGAIEAFGGHGFMGEHTPADVDAYRMVLAVGVAAAVLQIAFGLLRAGVLGEFFPLSAVHGMLAAIGVIIIAKHIPIALGVQGAKGEPLEMLKETPRYFMEMNPEIALIGGVGVLLMFLWPVIQSKARALKAIPAALVVLAATVPLGIAFDLIHKHTYSFHGHQYQLGESYLVNMPDRVFGMFDYITTPDWRAFDSEHLATALPWVFMFFIIGSLESLLSAKAVDIIDPWKRKTNLDRDMLAVGVGNLASAMVGGLPMISEIVRSKANIDNGARTRFADMWHGVFLLLCVALIPTLLHRIPLAALAAMLIYTGFRLTHPKEFLHVYAIGPEQLIIFVSTLVGVLATDLLIGILIGIGVKLLIHIINGVPIRSLFKSYLDVDVEDDVATVHARYSAVFSNWILFRRKLVQLGLVEGKNVILDLSQTRLVDHSVMEKLHELQGDFQREGLRLEVRGLEDHTQLSKHDFAARKQPKAAT
ncbi:MAG: SulP family inorganic anion transporter [Planctomycetales bacterium]|nr:SulP family inorganic anion transporter [Planctomycetales bacterium]